jgi:hypothetical protein
MTVNNTVNFTLTPEDKGRHPLANVSIGQATFTDGVPTEAFFVPIGNPEFEFGVPKDVTFALNYQGFGLPTYLWQ